MKYILIIGSGYRDCKAKFDELKKTPETKYPFITKVKHLTALEDNEYVLTDAAKDNPNFNEIIKVITQKKVVKPVVEEEVVKSIVEEEVIKEEILKNDDTHDKDSFYVYDNEQPALNERDNKWDEIVEALKENESNIMSSEPVIEEELIKEEVEEEPVVEEELIKEEVEEEPVVEEVKEKEIEEVVEPVVEVEIVEVDENVKPTNPPRGWHARKEFIDENGNIFEKGKFVGNING